MEQSSVITEIAQDTLEGLTSKPKYLLSKYFYDNRGSRIFQDIMHMPEYYLTDCEHEIFTRQKHDIVLALKRNFSSFDLIELGSGDGLKTKVLLQELVKQRVAFSYIPVDISSKAHEELESKLQKSIPELSISPKTGDYFEIMERGMNYNNKSRVVFFLGANIGNFSSDELTQFLKLLYSFTKSGDKVLIGFDLKKSPKVIMKAYDDPHGNTENFNLNYLTRLNEELDANFNINNFEHHTDYNPQSGAVKSYLISRVEHSVNIAAIEKRIHLKKWEPIYMELSRKFDVDTIENLANNFGFKIIQHFSDNRNYFIDSLWIRI